MVSRRNQYEYELFRQELAGLRSSAGLSQQELADLLSVGQDFVSRCESGKRRVDVVELARWCQACGSSLSTFATRLDLYHLADQQGVEVID
jgi:transcriptional regulator with XRE-family HTH domain